VFSRKNYRGYFTANGPEGSAGSENKSGWKTGDDFLLFMEHLIKHTKGYKRQTCVASAGQSSATPCCKST
jgi:hypothetical protein